MLHFLSGRHEEWHNLISEMETKIGAYVRGLAVLSGVVGVMATIAYLIIGLPSPLVLVLDAVPHTNYSARALGLAPLSYWRLGDSDGVAVDVGVGVGVNVSVGVGVGGGGVGV